MEDAAGLSPSLTTRRLGRAEEIMTDETMPQKILWMVEYMIAGTHYHRLEPVYAASREEAELQGRKLLARYGEQAVLIGVRPYPQGFVIKHQRVPGNLGNSQATPDAPEAEGEAESSNPPWTQDP
jgi:hypothetical protein